MKELEEERDNFVIPNENKIAEYHSIKAQLSKLNEDIRTVITHPSYCLPFIQPGRIVKVREGDQDFGWGCVINFQKKAPATKKVFLFSFFFPFFFSIYFLHQFF